LGYNDTILVLLERQQIDQRLIADDHPGGVHRGVSREVFEHEGGIDEFASGFFSIVSLLEIRRLLQRLVERHLQIEGDHLGQPVAFAVAQAHDTANVAHYGLRAHRAEGDDLGDGIASIFFADIFNDVGAAIVGEVDIDIGRIDAFRIEKTFEEQAVADGIDVGNLKQVGDDGACG